jgi:hypothetical protein
MAKLFFLISAFCLLACTNSSTSANSKDTLTSNTSNTGKVNFTQDELEFLGPCYDNAKARLGEQRAYSLCRCIYHQVQQKYPGADSATLIQHMSDTAEVRQMTMNCQ